MHSDSPNTLLPQVTDRVADSSASVQVDEITEQDGDYAHEVDVWRAWTNGGTDTAYARAQDAELDISWHEAAS